MNWLAEHWDAIYTAIGVVMGSVITLFAKKGK